MEKIELGAKVKNIVTGFTGIATARVEYLNGCIQYCVEGLANKDGKSEYHYIDEGSLDVVGKGIIGLSPIRKNSSKEKEPSGGVMPNTPPKF
jgi:hypothetical protein